MRIEFESPLWLWSAKPQTWTFVTVPAELSEMIREIPRVPRGFGSVRVTARIGSTEFTTSIFPSSDQGGYILPVKKAVRDAESLVVDDLCSIHLDVLDS